MRFRILLLALILLGAYTWWTGRPIAHPPGVLAPDAPAQINLAHEEAVRRDDHTFFKVASFEVTARVLGKKRYWLGKESRLAPYDLALGWGRMSDTSVLEQISINQSGRYYVWMVNSYPIPREEIISSSANMHLIPASEEVRNAISSVRRGDVIRFEGSLVRVVDPNGWRWNTSTTRTDTGPGACELVRVETFHELTGK